MAIMAICRKSNSPLDTLNYKHRHSIYNDGMVNFYRMYMR